MSTEENRPAQSFIADMLERLGREVPKYEQPPMGVHQERRPPSLPGDPRAAARAYFEQQTPSRDPWRGAGEIAGELAGGAAAYFIYRRLGAPRWAALGLADLAIRLYRLDHD